MSLTIRDKHDPEHTLDLGVTVDEAVSFITEAFANPLNPRWCAPCIVACMIVIQLDHNSAESLINGNHLFGSAIIAFLSAERSITAMEALASNWCKCKCSYADVTRHVSAKSVHHIVAGMEPVLAKLSTDPKLRNRAIGRFGDRVDVLGTMMEHLARFFVDAVSKVKPFSVAKGRHPEIWPTTPKDLIPYGVQPRKVVEPIEMILTVCPTGPETTIESFVRWSRFMGSAHVFSLLAYVMRICGPVVVPAIVASRSAPKYMIEQGSQICFDISKAQLGPNGQVETFVAKKFTDELRYILAFVQSLLTLPPLLSRDLHVGIAQSAFDMATQIIQTIESPIIPQSDLPDMKPAIDAFARYAATLCTTVIEQITVPKASMHPAIQAIMDRISAPSPPAEIAHSVMRHAKTIQFCFAPGCQESAQSSGRVYMRCSGCRVVAYSSKECQVCVCLT